MYMGRCEDMIKRKTGGSKKGGGREGREGRKEGREGGREGGRTYPTTEEKHL